MNFLPTKPPPLLSDHMYELLRERILGGAYKPGQRLDVGAIAQQLGVSQTPLKEALAALAREGLVEIKARSGTYVAQLATRDQQAQVPGGEVSGPGLVGLGVLEGAEEKDDGQKVEQQLHGLFLGTWAPGLGG